MTTKKMKIETLVRFAGDSTYYHRITIDPKKIEEPMVFPNEVFFTIDGTRVAVKKEDWKELEKHIDSHISAFKSPGRPPARNHPRHVAYDD